MSIFSSSFSSDPKSLAGWACRSDLVAGCLFVGVPIDQVDLTCRGITRFISRARLKGRQTSYSATHFIEGSGLTHEQSDLICA